MKQFKVNENLIQVTLQYLATRPYAEVFQLISELQKVEEIKAESINTAGGKAE